MHLSSRHSSGARVAPLSNGWRLEIPAGDASAYRFAQLDNYWLLPRRRFPCRPPFTLSLRARASSDSIPGTWGFGLWNDPFGLSLGFGGNPFRLPALPNAIWFFHASEENWLSFKSGEESQSSTFGDNPEVELRNNSIVGNGFLAQAFRSPKIPSPFLVSLGILSLPMLLPNLATRKGRRWLRELAGRFIHDDAIRLNVDQTHWHTYRIEWNPTRAAFWVDETLMLESPVNPRPPLGLVIWIDNQFAKFTPDGEIGFGVLETGAEWLEVEDLVCHSAYSGNVNDSDDSESLRSTQ